MSTPPSHRRCAAMRLLHHLETQLERQIPPTASRPTTSPGRLPAHLRPLPPGDASPPSLRSLHCHRLRRSPPANPRVPLRPVSPHGRRHDAAGPGNAPPAVFQKTVTSPSAWPRREPGGLRQEYGLQMAAEGTFDGAAFAAPDGTLEMDGLWTRTRSGRTELKVIRAAAEMALGSFGSLGRSD